jgi:lipoprotein-releasing system ATP-binding protein
MTNAVPDLSVQGLSKEFPTPLGPLSILHEVSLTMQRGDALSIVGPSGAGKSTLLYLLGGLDTPTAGTVLVGGRNPHQLPPAELAAFRNQQVGFVFQDHHLLPQCTVLENVLLPTLAGTGATPELVKRAETLLGEVGLSARLDHRPAQLSGGERQRVAVCRALILRPLLLLADEPTGNLDQTTAKAVGSLLLELSEREQAILICVTHSLDLASRFARRCELKQGALHPVTHPD